MSKPHTTNVVKKIYADGNIEERADKWTLQQMQKFVGGLIEFCPTTIPHRSLVVNEEGMLLNLPINEEATKLTSPHTWIIDGLRGNALLVKS